MWSRNIKNGCSIYIYIYDISSLRVNDLTLILLTWKKWCAPNNASKQRMGFNSAFKGLNAELNPTCHLLALLGAHPILHVSRIKVKYYSAMIKPTSEMFCMTNISWTAVNVQHSHSAIMASCLAYSTIIMLKIILIQLVIFLLVCDECCSFYHDKYCSFYLNFVLHVTVSCAKFCDWGRNTSSHCSLNCQWDNFIILCVGKRWHGKCLEQILN